MFVLCFWGNKNMRLWSIQFIENQLFWATLEQRLTSVLFFKNDAQSSLSSIAFQQRHSVTQLFFWNTCWYYNRSRLDCVNIFWQNFSQKHCSWILEWDIYFISQLKISVKINFGWSPNISNVYFLSVVTISIIFLFYPDVRYYYI